MSNVREAIKADLRGTCKEKQTFLTHRRGHVKSELRHPSPSTAIDAAMYASTAPAAAVVEPATEPAICARGEVPR
jgi:hypothetical protein